MPHSAWCAASSVSGVALAYGRISRSIAASSYQPFARATKKPVWLVFGVQSSARRTLAGSGGALGGRRRARWRAGCRGTGRSRVWPPLQAATTRATASATVGFGCHADSGPRCSASRDEERRPGTGRRRVRVLLPSLVRTRSGSAGLWSGHTLSAHALPGGGIQLPSIVALEPRARVDRSARDDVVDDLGPPARCGSRGGARVGPAGDAGSSAERLARRGRDEAVVPPWMTSVGTVSRSSDAMTRSCSASAFRTEPIVVA